jgi:hypothetical protein
LTQLLAITINAGIFVVFASFIVDMKIFLIGLTLVGAEFILGF